MVDNHYKPYIIYLTSFHVSFIDLVIIIYWPRSQTKKLFFFFRTIYMERDLVTAIMIMMERLKFYLEWCMCITHISIQGQMPTCFEQMRLQFNRLGYIFKNWFEVAPNKIRKKITKTILYMSWECSGTGKKYTLIWWSILTWKLLINCMLM